MKYFLIIAGTLLLLIFVGYRYFQNKMISSQERGFKQLASLQLQESPRHFPDSLRLSDALFWELIENSKDQYPQDFNLQMEHLTTQLSNFSNEQIVGFEMTLRQKVIALWDYRVKSLYQIIYGHYLSSDGFLYFRFWVISNGHSFYETVLEDTDEIANQIAITHNGEGLLVVADKAFLMKNGDATNLELPRDRAGEVDYDFGNYKMTGTYIGIEDFQKHFPKLTEKF